MCFWVSAAVFPPQGIGLQVGDSQQLLFRGPMALVMAG